MSVSTEMVNTPFPEMVRAMGIGIAEAQYELDLVSLKIARMMAGYMPDPEPREGETAPAPSGRPNGRFWSNWGTERNTPFWNWASTRHSTSSSIP